MINDLFYESEIEDLFVRQSMKQYGLNNSTDVLPYLFRRCMIVELDKNQLPKMKEEAWPRFFMNFWLKDLAIPLDAESFVYKETTIPTRIGYGTTLRNIYDNLLHQLTFTRIQSATLTNEWIFAKEEVSLWLKEAKRQGGKYRKKEIYDYLLKRNVLARLNEEYNADVQHPSIIEGIKYHDVIFKLSEEAVCERYLLAFHEEVTDGNFLTESELERYVIGHLEEIEPGIRMVQSQYILPKGRIDVLARDQEGNYVVIELKVEKDTDVVWQKWYYTEEIKKRYGANNVRFILILPHFHPEIIEPLLEDSTPTQILQIHPTIQRGKLKNATFTAYQPA